MHLVFSALNGSRTLQSQNIQRASSGNTGSTTWVSVPSIGVIGVQGKLEVSTSITCDLASTRTFSLFVIGLLTDLENLVLAFIRLRMLKSFNNGLWRLLRDQASAFDDISTLAVG